jgi:thiamine pyrophosphate-dependent acetolactate synthase large subunit-like protein
VVVGDGVALLSPLLAALASATGLRLSCLLVVLNNGGYRSVASTVKEFYSLEGDDLPLTQFPPDLAFERCADFVNGHGARVEKAHQFLGAFQTALSFTEREGRPAILNVILEAP